MRSEPVVAIDGPSGVGKSTVAKGLAAALGFSYVDTGALYRTMAWLADTHNVDWKAGTDLALLAARHGFDFDSTGTLFLDGKPIGDRIRSPRMSRGASAVAKHPEVREALLAVQRRLGKVGGAVFEGRDIGTVVFPDAEVKFFLTASSRVRAKRRFLELKARNEDVTLSEVEKEQTLRDDADKNRAISPLRQAEDAVEIHCDKMPADKVVEAMLEIIRRNVKHQ
ncbi:MAG: (d)CMP kinase [Proteobacteria bacterium]|nr:(d)CMP kinase [Pseudomonadota bacterium]